MNRSRWRSRISSPQPPSSTGWPGFSVLHRFVSALADERRVQGALASGRARVKNQIGWHAGGWQSFGRNLPTRESIRRNGQCALIAGKLARLERLGARHIVTVRPDRPGLAGHIRVKNQLVAGVRDAGRHAIQRVPPGLAPITLDPTGQYHSELDWDERPDVIWIRKFLWGHLEQL